MRSASLPLSSSVAIGRQLMHKHLPVLLIVCGAILIVGSFLFGASNALPYQDPTAEQLAAQSSKATMLKLTFFIGVLDMVAGFCLMWVRANKKRRVEQSQSSSEF